MPLVFVVPAIEEDTTIENLDGPRFKNIERPIGRRIDYMVGNCTSNIGILFLMFMVINAPA